MAKELTTPTPPTAPTPPNISIGDRIHGIENRIQEIEGIGKAHQKTNSDSDRQTSKSTRQSRDEEQNEQSDNEQAESTPRTTQQPAQRNQPTSRTVTTPESMARDAVANGSGALTKRTTTRKSDEETADADKGESHPKNQSTIIIPSDADRILNDTGQTSFERGRAVLNEFKQLDEESNKSSSNAAVNQTKSSTSSPSLFSSSYAGQSQHGAFYWIFTIVAIGVLAFVIVKQFLVKDKGEKPKLSKSDLYLSQPEIESKPAAASTTPQPPMKSSLAALSKLKTQSPLSKTAPIKTTPPPQKPLTLPKMAVTQKPVSTKNTSPKPKTEDENKGKHFEVRV